MPPQGPQRTSPWVDLTSSAIRRTTLTAPIPATPVEMPQPSLNVVNFSYMHWPIAKADPTGVARDLREHYVDTQVVVSSYLPNPVADAAGNITQPMDFSQLDKYMDLLPQTRLWIFFTGFEWDHRKMYPKPGEPRRERLFKQWLTAMIAHLKERGLGYENFAFLWHDEPSQTAMREIVAPSTAALRQVDSKAQVWIDISSDNTATSITDFADAADIWCPTSDKLTWDFWLDKRTWHYDSASDKAKSPTGHYRYKLWWAFKHGATGNGFWTYTDSSDLWDDYAGSPTYSVVYDGPDGVISSKAQATLDGAGAVAAVTRSSDFFGDCALDLRCVNLEPIPEREPNALASGIPKLRSA